MSVSSHGSPFRGMGVWWRTPFPFASLDEPFPLPQVDAFPLLDDEEPLPLPL